MTDDLTGDLSVWMLIADDEDRATLAQALPEAFSYDACTAHEIFRYGLDGRYGETHLFAWSGSLCGATRSSMIDPFTPIIFTARPYVEHDRLRATLHLYTEAGAHALPVMIVERERVERLTDQLVSRSARGVPGSAPFTARPQPLATTPAPTPSPSPTLTPSPSPAPEPPVADPAAALLQPPAQPPAPSQADASKAPAAEAPTPQPTPDDETIRSFSTAPLANPERADTRHSRPIVSAHLSADGRHAVTASSDGLILGWDVPRGAVSWELRDGHYARVSPDGRRLLVARDRALNIWSLEDDQVLRFHKTLPGRITQITCAPDSGMAVALCGDTAVLIELEKGKIVRELTAPGSQAHAAALGPDGLLLLAGQGQAILLRITRKNAHPLSMIPLDTATTHAVAISPDGQHLAIASDEATTLYTTDNPTRLTRWHTHAAPALTLTFSPAHPHLLAGRRHGALTLWHTTTHHELVSQGVHRADILDLAISADGAKAISVDVDGEALVVGL